jgi:hypothetical protein
MTRESALPLNAEPFACLRFWETACCVRLMAGLVM